MRGVSRPVELSKTFTQLLARCCNIAASALSPSAAANCEIAKSEELYSSSDDTWPCALQQPYEPSSGRYPYFCSSASPGRTRLTLVACATMSANAVLVSKCRAPNA